MPAEGCRGAARPAAARVRHRDRPVRLVRPQESELIVPPRFRDDLLAIFQSALAACSTPRLVERALLEPSLAALLHGRPVSLLAVGKASPFMASAFARLVRGPLARGLVVGTHCPIALPPPLAWHQSSHPVPDSRSEEAGRRALELARDIHEDEVLVVLLSGGASSLLALPRPPVTLGDKQATTRQLLRAGADIHELNTVRKHVSAIKGGQLAAAVRGWTVALAVSDVVSDDLSVIGSGPTVADPSTFAQALGVLERRGGLRSFPDTVVHLLQKGVAGAVGETPKANAVELSRAVTRIIGSRSNAVAGAAARAQALGYDVVTLDEPVVGEARDAGRRLADLALQAAAGARPRCILASGETTVTVTGDGRGGRNQELALAAAIRWADAAGPLAILSGGTDGIDGPTDAAGALADNTTCRRAAALGLDPARFLAGNDAYAFFQPLSDLVVTGPTDTNVGDVQILLAG